MAILHRLSRSPFACGEDRETCTIHRPRCLVSFCMVPLLCCLSTDERFVGVASSLALADLPLDRLDEDLGRNLHRVSFF
jgi:hypothetical protein